MYKINVKTALRKYPIAIGRGIFNEAHLLIKKNIKSFNKIILVTNEIIFGLYSKEIRSLCGLIGSEYDIVCLKDGEEYKNLDSAKMVYSRLIELNYHRNDIMIAFGGGVIGDTAGYSAATFHRGMKLVHIPTTIIAQVDSSIGGKVVVNFEGKKNIIGSFYQPHLIIADTEFLKSLDRMQVLNGLGEIVKYGLVFDKKILDSLNCMAGKKDYIVESITGYEDFIDIILKCAKIKARVVERDEFDIGYRNLLNFGHTIGHSIENLSGLKGVNHGQAVSMGMIAALEISVRSGLFPEEEKERIKDFFKKLGIPTMIPGMDANTILNGLKYDKKFTSGTSRFILLKKINQPFISENISESIIVDSINNCINI